jgi:hypothetical protein
MLAEESEREIGCKKKTPSREDLLKCLHCLQHEIYILMVFCLCCSLTSLRQHFVWSWQVLCPDNATRLASCVDSRF